MSRIRRNDKNNRIEKTTIHFTNFISQNAVPKAMTLDEIKNESNNDVTIQAIRYAIRTNHWHGNPLTAPFIKVRCELSDVDGIIMRGNRIVLPQKLQKKAMQIAHEGHLGTEKCKSLIRTKLYWPNMSADIERFVSECIPCKANSRKNAPEPLHPL